MMDSLAGYWAELQHVTVWLHNPRIIASLLLFAVLLTLRFLLIRFIRGRRHTFLTDDQKTWISRVKNSVLIMLILGLLFIWALELQNFALSITAFVVAIVLATKELILSLAP